jgi:hypothetical protein
MAIRIPPDARIIRDSRLNLVRVIGTLNDRLVNGAQGLKARIKAAMTEKGAQFAESDLVLGALRPGSSSGDIEPHKLHELVKAGQLTMDQFLSSVSVRKTALTEYLSGATIALLSTRIHNPEAALFTEFKEGVELDVDELAISLAGAIAKTVPIKAGAS